MCLVLYDPPVREPLSRRAESSGTRQPTRHTRFERWESQWPRQASRAAGLVAKLLLSRRGVIRIGPVLHQTTFSSLERGRDDEQSLDFVLPYSPQLSRAKQ